MQELAETLANVYIRNSEGEPVGSISMLRGKFVFVPNWDSGPNIPARIVTPTAEEMKIILAEKGLRTETANIKIDVIHNATINQLKGVAKNGRTKTARFLITKDGKLVVGDANYHTHSTMAPLENQHIRGYVKYIPETLHNKENYSSYAYSYTNHDEPSPLLEKFVKFGITPLSDEETSGWADEKEVVIKCKGDFNWQKLLDYMHRLGNNGSSRSIVCEEEDGKPLKLSWDGDGADKIISARIGDKDLFKKSEVASADPFLRSAVKHENKIYVGDQGELHTDIKARHELPEDAGIHGYLNHKSQFLHEGNNETSNYANENDLYKEDLPEYAKNAVTTDILKPRKFPKPRSITTANIKIDDAYIIENSAVSEKGEVYTTSPIKEHLETNGWLHKGNVWNHPTSKNQIVRSPSTTHMHHYTVTHANGEITRHKTNSENVLKKHISKLSKKKDNSYIAKTLNNNKGSLHEHFGIPHGQTIPLKHLEKLSKSNHPLAGRAKLVLNIKRAKARGPISYDAEK